MTTVAGFALAAVALSLASAVAGPALPGPAKNETPARTAIPVSPSLAVPTPLGLSCLGCHQPGLGSDATADAAAVDLARLDSARLKAALLAYRGGQREGTVMPRLARRLTDAEIEQLSRQLSRR